MKNGIMKYNGYEATIEFDDRDEILVGTVLGIDDILSFHATDVIELKSQFAITIDGYLEHCEAIGKEPDRTFSGRFLIRMDPSAHSRASKAAEIAGVSLNQFAVDVIGQAATSILNDRVSLSTDAATGWKKTSLPLMALKKDS